MSTSTNANAPVDAPPYASADRVINYAYLQEANRLGPSMSSLETRTSRGNDELTPLDKIAEGAMLMALVNGYAGRRGGHVLRVYYGRSRGHLLADRREHAMHVTAAYVLNRKRDVAVRRTAFRALLLDSVRDWAGERTRMSRVYADWATSLGVSRSTVARWTVSKIPDDASCHHWLNHWLSAAITGLEPQFRQRGLIP